ncbi:hypothetical protein TNCV_1054571 [Trichonephila clavipes]|nr:hypothetical protein TNCV_1054571 [Trichonephila clavipes]
MITVRTTFVTWNEGVLLYPPPRLETRMDGPHMSYSAVGAIHHNLALRTSPCFEDSFATKWVTLQQNYELQE